MVVLIPRPRSFYKLVVLVDGLHGHIIKNELCFIVFEGTMIVVAMFGLNDSHPGRLPEPESAPVAEIVTFDSSSDFHAKQKETGGFFTRIPRHTVDERSKV